MPLLIRATLAGALALAAVVAALFIVKAALTLATIVLVAVVALYLFKLGSRAARRLASGKHLTTIDG
ncbi:MAG: hypothetical protein NVSMB19_16240 [Vulcanimicrobiaceae bacterium]